MLADGGFDRCLEELCEPVYADGRGRPGIPSGVCFRMLLVGYFEGIGSQRGIAWRCADSLSLREFLGILLGEKSPDHSSLSVIRNRLPLIRIHSPGRRSARLACLCPRRAYSDDCCRSIASTYLGGTGKG